MEHTAYRDDPLCRADMGEGVECQRPVTKKADPLHWECGWGHRWYPFAKVGGEELRIRLPEQGH